MIEKYDLIPLDTRSSVVNYYANAVDVLNITGFYNISKENNEYQRIKNDLANLIANSYEKKANKDFHNSLNFFQKNGYFVNSVYNDHVKKVGFTKGAIELFTRTSMDIAPLIYDSYLLKRKNNKIADFITGWLGYINRSNSMLISYRVKEQFIKLNNLASQITMKINKELLLEILSNLLNLSKLLGFTDKELEDNCILKMNKTLAMISEKVK